MIKNKPLVVLGRMFARFLGEETFLNGIRRSSERMSVMLEDLPIGISAKAFLIQKLNIKKMIEKPHNVQPIGFLK